MEALPDETDISVSPLVSLHAALSDIRAFLCEYDTAPAQEREKTFVLVHDVELRLEFVHQKGIIQQFLRRNGQGLALRKVRYRQLTSLSSFLPLREYVEARFGRNVCGSGYALVSLDGLDSWFAQSRTFRHSLSTTDTATAGTIASCHIALREFERKLDRAERLLPGLSTDELLAARTRVLRLLEAIDTAHMSSAPTTVELLVDATRKRRR